MTIVCPKCRQVVRTTLAHVVRPFNADDGAAEFRRCGNCGGMAIVRAQPPRGRVVRDGIGEDVVEAGGEFVAVEKRAPKGWDERFAKEVA